MYAYNGIWDEKDESHSGAVVNTLSNNADLVKKKLSGWIFFILFERRASFTRWKRWRIRRAMYVAFVHAHFTDANIFNWLGLDPLKRKISISRHELTTVSSSRYFAVYPITGGLSDRSIGAARRTDVKLAFRQVSDWRSLRRKGRLKRKGKRAFESSLRNETNGALVVGIFCTKDWMKSVLFRWARSSLLRI